MKLAGAPISWGVCEVPGWGHQLAPARVLDEAKALGLSDIEAGPPGFLPPDAGEARDALAARGMSLVGGFVTAVLHDRARRAPELSSLERQARWLRDAGGQVLVLAAASGREGYEAVVELDRAQWRALFDGLARAAEIADGCGLELALHPHVGTAIERREHIERVLEGCAIALCLDTGHAYVGGADSAALARAAADRVRHVHLKDADGALAAAVRERRVAYADAVRRGLYRPLGDGAAGIVEVLDALKRRGYAGWGVLEQDVMLADERADPRPDIARSLAFARGHA